MKKVFLSIVAIAALVALPMSVSAQTVVGTNTVTSSSVTGRAKIIQPISITSSSELNFGTIASATTATTVTLTSGNTRSKTGGGTLITEGLLNIATTVPSFTVNGEKGAAYTITLPTTVQLKGTASASNTMDVTDFVTSLNADPDLDNNGTLDASTGSQPFTIGATLTVKANQVSDIYTGTFTVTTAYN